VPTWPDTLTVKSISPKSVTAGREKICIMSTTTPCVTATQSGKVMFAIPEGPAFTAALERLPAAKHPVSANPGDLPLLHVMVSSATFSAVMFMVKPALGASLRPKDQPWTWATFVSIRTERSTLPEAVSFAGPKMLADAGTTDKPKSLSAACTQHAAHTATASTNA